MTTKLLIGGAAITGVDDPLWCVWDDDPVAERTHSDAPQSMEWVGATFEWCPMTRAMWGLLNDAIDALAGRISTSLTGIGRNYNDPDSWATFTPLSGRSFWPERPKGWLEHHLIVGPGKHGGPIWHVARVAPARV